MISASYKPGKKFMELAIAEAKRAGDRRRLPNWRSHYSAHGRKRVRWLLPARG